MNSYPRDDVINETKTGEFKFAKKLNNLRLLWSLFPLAENFSGITNEHNFADI